MDVSDALHKVENSLRDFIAYRLESTYGVNWLGNLKISPDRVAAWEKTRAEEQSKKSVNLRESRILYFSQFYDLKSIIDKHWDQFIDVFKDKKMVMHGLERLNDFRNPEAHRRELLIHERHLILGFSGEIRTLIARYRSEQMNAESYFPFFEIARDNCGHEYRYKPNDSLHVVSTKHVFYPGDQVQFQLTATDPDGEPLFYAVEVGDERATKWQESSNFIVEINESHISATFCIKFLVKSSRTHHASTGHDDEVLFFYKVFPFRKVVSK